MSVQFSKFSSSESGSWKMGSKAYPARCHESHPVLSLGGGELLGASCNNPRSGFDIYVGFDYGMQRTVKSFPWDDEPSKIVEVYFPVTDGGVPADVDNFRRMVGWLVQQLAAGKRVHVGCIGGHGRTGTLLAAVVSVLHGDSKAGAWVRENYCKSAIETTAQINFLKTHFGIEPVEPSKNYGGVAGLDKQVKEAAVFEPMRACSFWSHPWVKIP